MGVKFLKQKSIIILLFFTLSILMIWSVQATTIVEPIVQQQDTPVPTADKGTNQLPVTPFGATETPVPIPPLAGIPLPPPYDITLPDGWESYYDIFQFVDLDELRSIPIALHTGPYQDGQAFILALWNFPNIRSISTDAENFEINLWTDGLRLLRLAVIEKECNIGTDLQRDYTVGGLDGVGTQFSAVDCPTTSNTRGWFTGLQVDNMNFVFYVFTEPIELMQTAGEGQLQEILDSVDFRVMEYVAEAIATQQAIPTATPTE